MSKFKKYSFWVALMSAVVLLIENLSAIFGFEFNKSIFESVFLSVCGILVVLGIIVKDRKEENINSAKEQDENSNNEDLNEDYKNNENNNISSENEEKDN